MVVYVMWVKLLNIKMNYFLFYGSILLFSIIILSYLFNQLLFYPNSQANTNAIFLMEF